MWPEYEVLKVVYSKGALKPKGTSKNIYMYTSVDLQNGTKSN